MIQRERVADNVYSFQSDVYAQVTAGAVIGPNWAVVIDTLAMPEETLAIRDFIEQDLSVPVRYVINTHYHADHAWGTYFFPGSDCHRTFLVPNMAGREGDCLAGEQPEAKPGIPECKNHLTANYF
jgi:glyoxylase-like metal-dependent hydrolase (beta-lactamase superfamily II)